MAGFSCDTLWIQKLDVEETGTGWKKYCHFCILVLEKTFVNTIDIQEDKQSDHITNQSRVQTMIF